MDRGLPRRATTTLVQGGEAYDTLHSLPADYGPDVGEGTSL